MQDMQVTFSDSPSAKPLPLHQSDVSHVPNIRQSSGLHVLLQSCGKPGSHPLYRLHEIPLGRILDGLHYEQVDTHIGQSAYQDTSFLFGKPTCSALFRLFGLPLKQEPEFHRLEAHDIHITFRVGNHRKSTSIFLHKESSSEPYLLAQCSLPFVGILVLDDKAELHLYTLHSKFQRAMMLIQGCSLISKLDDLPF